MKNTVKKTISLLLALALSFTMFVTSNAVKPKTEEKAQKKTEQKIYSNATIEDDFSSNEIIVVMNKENSGINKKHGKSKFKGVEIESIEDLTQMDTSNFNTDEYLKDINFHQILKLTLKTNDKKDVLKVIKHLEKRDDVISAEPSYREQLSAIPNDPYYSSQWDLPKIGMPSAWDITKGSASVRVGIIDTGIASHPDLNSNLTTGWDFYNNNSITTDDTNGHGTHVAGTVGAVGNNSVGVTGIAQIVKLVPLQACDSNHYFYSPEVIKAITWSITNNVPIINYSVSGYGSSNAMYSSIQNYPGLFVWAAGNDGSNIDSRPYITSFSNLPNLISVANSTNTDSLSSTSNYSANNVHIAAPGTNIYNTYRNNSYTTMSGTSMAAPHVAGVAALIKAKYPLANAANIKNAVLQTATRTTSLQNKVKSNGRLNALGAVNYYNGNYSLGAIKTISGNFSGNSNGKSDIASIYDLGNGDMKITVWKNGTSKFTSQTWHTATSYNASSVNKRYVSGDFNGDGKDDIAAMYDYGGDDLNAIHVWLSTGSSFSYQGNNGWFRGSQYSLGQIGDRFISGDFNADGKDDIATMYNYGGDGSYAIHVWLSTGSSFSYRGNNGWFGGIQYPLSQVENRFISGDFNADGKDDIATMYNYGGDGRHAIHVWLSTGSSFSYQGNNGWFGGIQYPLSQVENRFISGDFNADGKDDISTMYYYSNEYAIHVWLSTGSTLAYQGNTGWFRGMY